MSDYEQIRSIASGDLVAGEYIAVINGKHTKLGQFKGGAFVLTMDGHALLAEQPVESAEVKVTKPKIVKPKAAEPAKVETAAAKVPPASALPVAAADAVAAALNGI